jgi:mannan endo-1,4-beta-mannosidase
MRMLGCATLALALLGSASLSAGEAEPDARDVASRRARAVLAFLKGISGRQVVSGIHNREPNAVPDLQTREIHDLVGAWPGLWSGDFLFKADDVNARWAMVYECRRQWDAGAIVQLMLHVAPPNQPEACPWEGGILSHLDDEEWKDLVTDGGALNTAWKSRLDGYATYLGYLQDRGVPVLFRPFHEMNQGRFWWGGRTGPDGTARLYRLTHDYLVNDRGLSNLIWVWDMQDLSRELEAYDPGGAYWDVFAFDVYESGYDRSWYESILPLVGDKPMGIGECAILPSEAMLDEQPRWAFFMSWAELTFTSNSPARIRELYRRSNVLTRDRLPRFE